MCKSTALRKLVLPLELICGLKPFVTPWHLFGSIVYSPGIIISAFGERFIHSAIHCASKVSGMTTSDTADTKVSEADSMAGVAWAYG